MSYFVHKINISRWPDGKNQLYGGINALSGDAITLDLRTDNNCMSWWMIKDLDEIGDVAIAIASTYDSKDKIYVVAVEDNVFRNKSILIQNNKGKTAFSKYENSHYDIIDINMAKLSAIADIVAVTTQDKNKIKYLSKNEINNRIRELNEDGLINVSNLGKAYKEIVQ